MKMTAVSIISFTLGWILSWRLNRHVIVRRMLEVYWRIGLSAETARKLKEDIIK